jgi:50S ribosomal subunit-associated GTPase HflX
MFLSVSSIYYRVQLSHLSICVIDSSDWRISNASIPDRIPILDPMVMNHVTEKTMMVLNKWDLLDDQQKSNMVSHFRQFISPATCLVPISCKTGEGLSDVWRHLSSLIEKEYVSPITLNVLCSHRKKDDPFVHGKPIVKHHLSSHILAYDN